MNSELKQDTYNTLQFAAVSTVMMHYKRNIRLKISFASLVLQVILCAISFAIIFFAPMFKSLIVGITVWFIFFLLLYIKRILRTEMSKSLEELKTTINQMNDDELIKSFDTYVATIKEAK